MSEFKIDPNLVVADYRVQIASLSDQLATARAAFNTLQRMYDDAMKPKAEPAVADEPKGSPA